MFDDGSSSSLAGIGLQLLFFSPLGFAAVGLILALARKWVVMGWEYKDAVKDRDAWKNLYEKSQSALADQTQATYIANARADTANDTAQVATRLLQALQSAGGARAPVQP